MPTELEELVEFLHHGNTQIRQIATENLVPYSKTKPSIFKSGQLRPVRDLKLLVRDYAPIAKQALTILINITEDQEILETLATDDVFLTSVLTRITNPSDPNAESYAMLLANLSKSSSLSRLSSMSLPLLPVLSPSTFALDQLIELFNRGTNGGYNHTATFDYLAYVFADLVKHLQIREHLLKPTLHDSLPPLTTLLPFTSHPSLIRRLGTATLLRNIALSVTSPLSLLSAPISLLPYILLPLCGPQPDSLSAADIESLLPELQYLGAEQKREADPRVLTLLLECLYLLVVRGGKECVKDAGAYVVVRELHLEIEDEGIRGLVERIVDVLMGDEEGFEEGSRHGNEKLQHAAENSDSDDDKIVPIF